MLLWDTFFAAGLDKLNSGDLSKALALFKSALSEAEGFEPKDPRQIRTRLALVEVYQKSGDLESVSPLLAAVEEQVEGPHELPTDLVSQVFKARLLQLELAEAPLIEQINLAHKLASYWKAESDDKSTPYLESLTKLASLLERAGDRQKAQEVLQEALEESKKIHVEVHPETARIQGSLARLIFADGDLEAAEKKARLALSSWKGSGCATSSELAEAQSFLADILERQKRFGESLELAESAAGLEGPDHARFQLKYVAALIKAKKSQQAMNELLKVDKAGLDDILITDYELLKLRAFGGVGDHELLLEQSKRLASLIEASAPARIEALVVLCELVDNPLQNRPQISGYLDQIDQLSNEEIDKDPDLLTRIANIASAVSRKDLSSSFYDRAISARSRDLDLADPACIQVLDELGKVQERRRLLIEASSSWEKALETMRRHAGHIATPAEERNLRLQLIKQLAGIYTRQLRWERAEKAWRSLVRSSPPETREHIRGRLGLVQVYTEQNQNHKALETLSAEGNAELSESSYGRSTSDAGFLLYQVNLVDTKSLDLARQQLEARISQRGGIEHASIRELAAGVYLHESSGDRAPLKKFVDEFARRSPTDVEEQLLYAKFYALIARHNASVEEPSKLLLKLRPLEAFSKAASWCIEANGELDLRVASLLEEKAQAAIIEGQWEQAQEATERTIEIRKILQGDRSPTLLLSLQRLGELQLGKGQIESSLHSLEDALTLAEAHLKPEDGQIRELLRSLLEARRRQGELRQAERYLKRLLELYQVFSFLRPEEKLGDLLRGIRLLLDGAGSHQLELNKYLDEAIDLAQARGEIGVPNLAFCLGQKARILMQTQPDAAIGLLRRQHNIIESREEASEFISDQLLLARLLLYRGQPLNALDLLEEQKKLQPFQQIRQEHQLSFQLLEAEAHLQLDQLSDAGRVLDFLEELLQSDRLPSDAIRAQVLAIQLSLYIERPDLVGDEPAAHAYAGLDDYLEEFDWDKDICPHELKEHRHWELTRLRFEITRLSSAAALERLREYIEDLSEEDSSAPSSLAEPLALLAHLEVELGLEREALEHYEAALKASDEAGDAESISRARILGALAEVAEKLNSLDLALGAYREAVGDLKTHLGALHVRLLPLYLGIGRINRTKKDSLAAEAVLMQALAIVEQDDGSLPSEQQAQAIIDLAELFRADGRLNESLELWKRVESIYLARDEFLPTIWLEPFLDLHISLNKDAEALDHFLDSLPFRLGHQHDSILLKIYCSWLEHVATASDSGNAKARAELLCEVREVFARAVEDDSEAEKSLLWARALIGFANIHFTNLMVDIARTKLDLSQALKLRELYRGPDSIEVSDVLVLIARLAQEENDLTTAESCLTRALNISEAQGNETWDIAKIHLKLAEVYFVKGKTSATETLLNRTLELCDQLLDKSDARWIQVYSLKGKLSLELNRRVEAYEALDQAIRLSHMHSRPLSYALLSSAGRAALLTERQEIALDLLLQAEKSIPTDLADWDLDAEEISLFIGELLLAKERFQEAELRLTRVLSAQEKRYGFGDSRLARISRNLVISATGQNQLDLAEERLELVLAFQEDSLFQPYDLFLPVISIARAHQQASAEQAACALLEDNLNRCKEQERFDKAAQLAVIQAESYQVQGNDNKAEEVWRDAIECWDRFITEASPVAQQKALREELHPLQALATLLTEAKRYTEAEELTKRRLKAMEQLGCDDKELTETNFDLAELYRSQELYDKAEELHQKVLGERAAELGRSNPEIALSERALGKILIGKHKPEQALVHLERALEIQESTVDASRAEIPDTLFSIGEALLAKQNYSAAEERYRQALEILQDLYGADNMETARGWIALSQLYQQKQQWSQAPALLGRAMESVEATLGTSHLEVARLLMKTAEVYFLSGSWDKIADLIDRALTIRIEKLGENHQLVARCLLLKGDLSLVLGYSLEARNHYQKAEEIIDSYYGPGSEEKLPVTIKLAAALRENEELRLAEEKLQALSKQSFWQTSKNKELGLADINEELAQINLAKSKLSVAEQFVKQALEARSSKLAPEDDKINTSIETLAQIHFHQGKLVTSSALAEKVLEARTHTASSESKTSTTLAKARILCLLSRIELAQGQISRATQLANEALTIRTELLGEKHPEVAACLFLLGDISLSEKRLEKTESFYKQALKCWQEFYGSSHPKVFKATASLATLLTQQGRLTLAEQYYQQNLTALEERYGSEDPILADTLIGLGKLCRSAGNAAAAERYLKRAVELQTMVYGNSDPRVAAIFHTLALVYQDQRNYLAAEALFKKALQIREKNLDQQAPELCESNLALARLYRNSGKSPEAEPLLKKVLEWRSRHYGDNHQEVAAILREMAEVFADQKQYLKAQVLVRRALDIYGAALGHKNLELVGPLRQLARLLEAAGEREEAQVQRKRAQELMGST